MYIKERYNLSRKIYSQNLIKNKIKNIYKKFITKKFARKVKLTINLLLTTRNICPHIYIINLWAPRTTFVCR